MRRNLSNLLRVGGLLLLVLLVTSPRIVLAPQTPMPGTADMGGMFAPGTTTAIPSHHFHPASGFCPPYYQPPYPPVYLPPGLYECWPCVCVECEEGEAEPSFTIGIPNGNGKDGNGKNGEDTRRREREERIKREYERIPQWIWHPLPLREYIRKPTDETPEDRPDLRPGEDTRKLPERTWPYPPGVEPGEDTRELPERIWPYPPVLEEPIRVDITPPMLEGTVYPVSESGWINRNVKVTLHAGDEESGSGIAAIHYLWNGKQVTIAGEDLRLSPDRRTATHKIALQDDGIHELVCWTVDASGNESNRTSSTIRIDKIAPGISATSVPTTEGGWGNANVKVTLKAQDQAGGSGIASIEYTLDGRKVVIERTQLRQTYDTFTHKFAVTEEGVHQLTFQTKDLAGNWSASGSQTIRIDRTPPMIETTRSPAPGEHGWNNQDVIVRFHCSDDLSGIASCTNEQRVSIEGSAQIVMGEAVDRAGNWVKAYVIDINIDKTPPSVSVSPYSLSIIKGEATPLTIEASDSGSGIAYVVAEDSTSGRISLERGGNLWIGNLQPTQDGQITVRVTDRADNVTTRSVSYTVASPAPARASFSSSPTSGDAPLEVKFVNKSTGEIASCEWNFGDGSSSHEFTPVHTYESAGRYKVMLLVEGPGGASAAEFCCIKVMEPEVSLVPLRIAFEDGSVEKTVSYEDITSGRGPDLYCSGTREHEMWLAVSNTTGSEESFRGLVLGLGYPVDLLIDGVELRAEGVVLYIWDALLGWHPGCGTTFYLQGISGTWGLYDNLQVSNIITLHIRPCK